MAASFGPLTIILIIFWVVRAIINAGKKNKAKRAASGTPAPNRQPGKSIQDILRELERRNNPDSFEEYELEETELEPVSKKVWEAEKERSVADYKLEKQTNLAAHHAKLAALNDGNFDDIDYRLLALESNTVQSEEEETPVFTVEDARRAIVLDAVFNRPEF